MILEVNLKNTWRVGSKLYREGKAANRGFVIKWGNTVGNWSVIPQRIPWIQCRRCCSKWFHLRSEGLGSLYPSFWQASDVEFAGCGIEFPGSWAWGNVWQWYEWEHSTWSPAMYATSYMCTYSVSLYLFPHSLWKILWFYFYSLNTQISRECVYIFI